MVHAGNTTFTADNYPNSTKQTHRNSKDVNQYKKNQKTHRSRHTFSKGNMGVPPWNIDIWPASCEKGPSDICKKERPRPAAASPTPRLVRVCTFDTRHFNGTYISFCVITYRYFKYRFGGLILVYTMCNVRMSLFTGRWPFRFCIWKELVHYRNGQAIQQMQLKPLR